MATSTGQQIAEQHTAESQALQAAAEAALSDVLSTTLLEASRQAIRAATGDRSALDVVREQVADQRSVSVATAWQLAVDVAAARDQCLSLLRGAIVAGYRADLLARTEALSEQVGRELVASVTAEDVAALEWYPILGHTAAAIADREAADLDFGARGAIAQPATSTAPLADLPQALDTVQRLYGQRCGGWVLNAYLAGTQAAQLELHEVAAGLAR